MLPAFYQRHCGIIIVMSSSKMISSSSFSYHKIGSVKSNAIGEDLSDIALSDGLVGG